MPRKVNNFHDLGAVAPVAKLADARDLKCIPCFAATADSDNGLPQSPPEAKSASDSFKLEERRRKDRIRKKKYRAENKPKLKAYFKGYYRRHADEMKANALRWQAENPEAKRTISLRYQKRHPAQTRARLAVANALRSGKLVRQPCEVCGAPKVHAHHDSYRKPLDVRWLCSKHHGEADCARRAKVAEKRAALAAAKASRSASLSLTKPARGGGKGAL